METLRVRQFCVIAETLNLRKSSELLGISHGGLSKSLKVLENELGFELFNRDRNSLSLTLKGIEFLPKAKRFLKSYDELIDVGPQVNELKLGSFEVFSTHFFAEVLAPVFSDYTISLREYIPGKLEESLLEKIIDYGLTYEPIPTHGIEIKKIGQTRMGIFGDKKFNKMSLENLPFVTPIIPIQSHISVVKGLDGWPDHKIKRKIMYQVDLMETALQLCTRGLAVGYFPSFVVDILNSRLNSKNKLKELEVVNSPSLKKNIYITFRSGFGDKIIIDKIKSSLTTWGI